MAIASRALGTASPSAISDEGGVAAAKAEALRRLTLEIQGCFRCPAMDWVHVLGPANGPLDADIMFLAEAPGRLGAAVTGVPLTRDASGRRFEALLALAGLSRQAVYVTNAVLCNPLTPRGSNRRPSTNDLRRCSAFLATQIALVEPRLVVSLGRVALDALRAVSPHDYLLRRDVGQLLPWSGRLLLPLYHPAPRAAAHRPLSQQERDWRRLRAIARVLDLTGSAPGRLDDGRASRLAVD